ncbi:MAG: ABC transporter ATP-binding protein [Verrucomicrobiia bacterium]
MEKAPAISIRGITKRFPIPFRRRAVLAVDQLSLEVGVGEVYGLLGPNGSGKSTTLKVALGLLSPDEGEALIFGQSSQKVSSREAVGFVPENPYFQKFLTGAETVRFFGRLCGLGGRKLEQRIEELLDLVGLTSAADRRLGGYSKGMLQRIGLAQALVQEPRLVILDEPTAGVDPTGSREIKDLILKLKAQGITVLLCSHLLAQVQEICDRVGIMNRGRLVKEGRLEDLISVADQVEMRFEAGGPELPELLRKVAEERGARVLAVGSPRSTLEDYFLQVTSQDQPGNSQKSSP